MVDLNPTMLGYLNDLNIPIKTQLLSDRIFKKDDSNCFKNMHTFNVINYI